jgi:cytochrome b561
MFKKTHSIGIRIWHWSNSAVITLLLATVVLRKTFLSVKENKTIIINKAQELGTVLSDSQAANIAKLIRNQMWQWHPIIGFVAIGLLLFRFIIFLKDRTKNTEVGNRSFKYKMVQNIHRLYYVILLVMGFTGSLLYWEEGLKLSEGQSRTLQNIHETLLWFFIVFILTHIIGVIKAEQGEDKGIISDMINGGQSN